MTHHFNPDCWNCGQSNPDYFYLGQDEDGALVTFCEKCGEIQEA